MDRVAVVGLGAMGSRIACRLLESGYDVVVWNRSPEKLEPLLARGATAMPTPREAARSSRTLITMLAGPEALRSVCEAPDGLVAGAHPDLVVVEMSTVGPEAVAALASFLKPTAAQVVDAPVLGSVGEVEAGALTIFAGGADETLDRVRPLLDRLGAVIPIGPLGAGAAAKLVANAALLGTIALLGETLALADRLELAREATTEVLRATPLAEQERRRAPLIEADAYPRRFGLSLARKDANLVIAAGARSGARLRMLESTRDWLVDAERQGRGDSDYTAMLATILARDTGSRPSRDRSEDDFGYDGLIVDLDGVVWLGGRPIDGVAAALASLRARDVRALFVTNDPQHSRATQAAHLSAIGIPATAADVLTASAAAAAMLADEERLAGARVLVVGSEALRDEFTAAGFEIVPHADSGAAALVIVGGHEHFDYAELRAATRAVGCGAALYATGRDPFVPTAHGREPATGAILAAIETATGATATITGKPEPHLFALARNLLAGCSRVAVVGDNLASDIAGAKRAGLDTILVLSGATSRDDLVRADVHPDLVLASLAALDGSAST